MRAEGSNLAVFPSYANFVHPTGPELPDMIQRHPIGIADQGSIRIGVDTEDKVGLRESRKRHATHERLPAGGRTVIESLDRQLAVERHWPGRGVGAIDGL